MPEELFVKIRLSVALKSRIARGIRKFKNVFDESLLLGINRFNTATVVLDMFKEILGYDKYSEITSDHDIKNNSCVDAVRKSGKLLFILDIYSVQFDVMPVNNIIVSSYMPYQNLEHVIVTNGIYWKIFRIDWGQALSSIDYEFDFMSLDPKNHDDIKKLLKLCRENF